MSEREIRAGTAFSWAISGAPAGVALEAALIAEDGTNATPYAAAGVADSGDGFYIATRNAPAEPGTYYGHARYPDPGPGDWIYGDEPSTFVVVDLPGVSLALSDDDGYPDLPSLLAASTSGPLLALDEAAQLALRASAIDAVEAHCRQSFVAEGTLLAPVTRRLDGSGTSTLYLPKRLALATALSLWGHLFTADTEYEVGERGDYVRLLSPLGGSWTTRVRRDPQDPGPYFDTGESNVEVAGVWGWTAEEWAAGRLSAVETALRFDMEDQAQAPETAIADTVAAARALGLSSISQGNMSMTLRKGGGLGASLSVRVQRKLAGLRWGAPVGATA